jgi:hypothetical protein
MLKVFFNESQRELLVEGFRDDYLRFGDSTREVLVSDIEAAFPVESNGPTDISQFVVRRGNPPNRVSLERGRIIFSVAPGLERQFLSFISFPEDGDLPDSPIQYHHHFDGLTDDGTHVASDSLPVVFGLKRAGVT